MTPVGRDRVLEAAARVFSEVGVVAGRRRDIAQAAGVPSRVVTALGRRIDLLRAVVERLPMPPVAEQVRVQAEDATEPALQTLLQVLREIFEDPSAGWSPLELQALLTAPYDERIREIESERFAQRWANASRIVHQMRGEPSDSVPDDIAALHLIAVGLGVAVLRPLSERLRDADAWAALTTRLLEALAADEIPRVNGGSVTWRARVSVPASAAHVARVLRALSLLDVRASSMFTAPGGPDRQLLDLIMRAPERVERKAIVDTLSGVASDVIVTRGGVDDTQDVATRVLQLSAALAKRPQDAPKAAATLVLADSWEVSEPASGDDASALVMRLQWTVDRHVVLRRVKAPFTTTERNRASALLELVAALGDVRGESTDFGWRETTRDGRDVTIRLGRPQDTAGVEAMHDRCSQKSKVFRYFAPMTAWREDNLRRISGGHRGATLVVTDDDENIIALGNLFPIEPGVVDEAEIAVIVEDRWHRQGIGHLVLKRLIDVAERQGFERLVAFVLSGNRSMIGLLESTGLSWEHESAHDLGASALAMRALLHPGR